MEPGKWELGIKARHNLIMNVCIDDIGYINVFKKEYRESLYSLPTNILLYLIECVIMSVRPPIHHHYSITI